MAELGVPPPTGLYPQPPSQGGGALSDPTRLIDLLGAVTRNQMLQNELKAKTAIGQAYQGALQPDGSFDPNKLAAGLRGNPDAAWALPDVTSQMLQQQGAQFDIRARQDAATRSIIGTLPPNATDEQIRHYGATLARAGVPPAIISGHLDALLATKGRQRAEAIADLQNSAIGPAGIATQVEAPPTGAGVPQRRSLGGTIRQQAGTGTTEVGQAPGEAGLQEASAAGAAALEGTGQKTSQIHADLENLRQLNKDIPLQGPAAEFEKKLNQVGARLGIGVTMTRDQLAKSEEFDKIANQLSLNQSTMFHGSDAGLHTTIAANPNLGMSRYGREGVIDMLQGNQDAIDRTRQLWFESRRRGANANSFNDFINQSGKVVDPRLFQFNRMSAENQKKFAQDMDPADVDEFKEKYRWAVKSGWVKPPKTMQQTP